MENGTNEKKKKNIKHKAKPCKNRLLDKMKPIESKWLVTKINRDY